MKRQKILSMILSSMVTLCNMTTITALADEQPEGSFPVLSEQAYEMLEQEQGLTRSEIDQMLNTRTCTTYVNDYIYNVYAIAMSGNEGHIQIESGYDYTDVSYYGTVLFGDSSVNTPNFSSTGVTYTTDIYYSSLGKIFTYRICLTYDSNPDVVLTPPPTVASGYTSLGYVNSWIALGDVDDSGVIDIADYILLCNFVAEALGPNDYVNPSAADINQDGYVTSGDCLQLMDYIMKRIDHIWG